MRIPKYRLDNSLLSKEIKDIEALGVEFKQGVEFGKDFDYKDLFDLGYRAILVSIGAHKPKFMGIPGEDLIGNIHAIDFLRDVALEKETNLGTNVIVIGGGDVAIDAVRVASRFGANASLVYRRSREEMPATKEEIHETENEGIPIHFLTNPIEIIGKNGKVAYVKMMKMVLGDPDESGRGRPEPITGSEYFIEVDTVIQAISQTPDIDQIKDEGFTISQWNTFEVDTVTLQTNIDGVFAAGDSVSGPKTAIEAIVQGKKAVTSIHQYIQERYPEEEFMLTQ